VKRIEWGYIPTTKQAEAHRHPATIKLYGGAMGGGKTYWLCAEAIQRSAETAGNRIALVRKTRTAIVRTTLTTFMKLCPPELIADFNKQQLVVTFHNRSEILFLGADTGRDPLLDELKSLEVSTIGLEEVTQMQRRVLSVASERKDRWVTSDGVRPRGGILCTCNPEIGWVKELFYDRWLNSTLPRGWAFIPALPGDNPHLSSAYLADMREILTPDEQDRYLRGMWTAAEDPARLIPYQWVKDAQESAEPVPPGSTTDEWIAADIAFEGDDNSALWWVRWAGKRAEAELVARLHGADEEEVAEAILRFIELNRSCDSVVVDATGIGSGVATIVARRGRGRGVRRVVRFKGGGKAVFDGKKLEYRNLRDQGWWHLREALKSGNLALPQGDYRLAEDLTSPRVRIGSERRVEVEHKKDIKRRLGRSPDDGDALSMAILARMLPTARPTRAAVVT